MKHFIYTYKEGRVPRNGSGIKKTAVVYEILTDQSVVLVGDETDTFVSEYGLVMSILQNKKALPPDAFERNTNHGGLKYASAYSLEQAGFAKITAI